MDGNATPLFSCHDLRVEVPSRVLVDGLTFESRPGELLAVLGQNGSGKTLTMHTLAGLRPTAATVRSSPPATSPDKTPYVLGLPRLDPRLR